MINNSIEKNENAKRTTFIYKFVDKQHLGVKMYEDDSIGTIPYSFYGGRKLYHVNNQMVDADEKFIEKIVNNWGVQPFFQPLVLKTIYCFVGKSFTMYTLEIGSEVPVKKRTCEHLKQWLEELEIKKSSNVATSYGNSKELSQRIQDTSNEIFHLTKLIEKKLTMVANLSPSNVPTTEDQVKNPQGASFPSPRKKILGREQINKHLVAEMKEESNRFSGSPNGKHRQLVFRKNPSNEVLQPKTWLSLTKFVYSTKRIVSYHRKIGSVAKFFNDTPLG